MTGVWERLIVDAARGITERETAKRLVPNLTDSDLDFISDAWKRQCPYQAWDLAAQIVTKWKANRPAGRA